MFGGNLKGDSKLLEDTIRHEATKGNLRKTYQRTQIMKLIPFGMKIVIPIFLI